MTGRESSDAIEKYISATRRVVRRRVPSGPFRIAQMMVAGTQDVLKNSGHEVPDLKHHVVCTLNKFSEHACLDGENYLVTDQFFSFQSAFLNKHYFAIPDTQVIDAYFQSIAAQRALLHRYVGVAQLLAFAQVGARSYERFVNEVKAHLAMDELQRALICCHEYVHVLRATERSHQKQFEHFSDTLAQPAHLESFFEAVAPMNLNLDEFESTMRDRRFAEELFCDFRAANYVFNVFDNQQEIFGRTIFTLYDFMLAAVTYFINLQAISAVDAAVDRAVLLLANADTVRLDAEIARLPLELNLRRVYMSRTLRSFPEMMQLPERLAAQWNEVLSHAARVSDEVAMKHIAPSVSHICNTVVPLVFNAASSRGFPVAGEKGGDPFNPKLRTWESEMLKAIGPNFDSMPRMSVKAYSDELAAYRASHARKVDAQRSP